MRLELRPRGSTPAQPDFVQVEWGAVGGRSDVKASVDCWLTQLGVVDSASIDLVRIATAAFLADRRERRGAGYSRTIAIHVQLVDPNQWTGATHHMEALLRRVSGDAWTVTVSADNLGRPGLIDEGADHARVALYSGGLDSFCGAVLSDEKTLFVSHTDNRIVTAAQTRTWDWLESADAIVGSRMRITLSEASGKVEPSTRTRSVLFYSLAVAAAISRGAQVVEVPENGFTSVNIPLGGDRGGVLTTRSTHPLTILHLQTLLEVVGIDVDIVNPYQWKTKGELVHLAHQSMGGAFSEGAALTHSCAKNDSQFFKGGNAYQNCGACVACMTRRGGFLSSGTIDQSSYPSITLEETKRQALLHRRRADLAAVRSAVERAESFDALDLVASGAFPPAYDFEAGADLVRRGLHELKLALEALE